MIFSRTVPKKKREWRMIHPILGACWLISHCVAICNIQPNGGIIEMIGVVWLRNAMRWKG